MRIPSLVAVRAFPVLVELQHSPFFGCHFGADLVSQKMHSCDQSKAPVYEMLHLGEKRQRWWVTEQCNKPPENCLE